MKDAPNAALYRRLIAQITAHCAGSPERYDDPVASARGAVGALFAALGLAIPSTPHDGSPCRDD